MSNKNFIEKEETVWQESMDMEFTTCMDDLLATPLELEAFDENDQDENEDMMPVFIEKEDNLKPLDNKNDDLFASDSSNKSIHSPSSLCFILPKTTKNNIDISSLSPMKNKEIISEKQKTIRKIKNRASAISSRHRKKSYLQLLETHVLEAEDRKEALVLETQILSAQLASALSQHEILLQHNTELRKVVSERCNVCEMNCVQSDSESRSSVESQDVYSFGTPEYDFLGAPDDSATGSPSTWPNGW